MSVGQRSLRSAWASDQSLLSAWRKLGSLATHWAHSKDWSDWADQINASKRCRQDGKQYKPWSECSFSESTLFAKACLSKNLGSLHLWYEPAHEIWALFVLRKLILQTRMRSHTVGLDVWFLVGSFIYFHISCVRTAMALAKLRRCAGSPEPLLIAYVVSTIISWACSYTGLNIEQVRKYIIP